MNRKYEYVVGKVYGILELKSLSRDQNGSQVAFVRCVECGREKTIRANYLMSSRFNSCLCKLRKHNRSSSRIYRTYCKMKDRCYNPRNCSYRNYGAKNIKICEEWLGDKGFQNFYQWAVTHGYNDTLSIERKDPNQGYTPSNCEWITLSENIARANKYNVRNHSKLGAYEGISPDGEVYRFDNASEFARNNPPLNAGCIRDCANAKRRTHHGWSFKHINSQL